MSDFFVVEVDDKDYNCNAAKTEAERAQGLQNIEELPNDKGMIFFHEKPDRHGYWMKNTKVPLTMIFLDGNGEVVDVKHRKDTMSLENKKPDQPCQIVIELPYNEDLNIAKKEGVTIYKNE